MNSLIYAVAAMGFLDAGWGFWKAAFWPYHLAKNFGAIARGVDNG